MKAGIINKATVVTDSDLLQQTIVCTKQAREHAAPVWGWTDPELEWLATDADVANDVAVGYALDDSDAASALGYHDALGPNGQPYFRSFYKTAKDNGVDGATVTGHELLEMLGDPDTDKWAPHTDGYDYAVELCDAVEGDEYELDGRKVTNFVYPSFFDPNGQAPYDRMGLVKRPFETRPQGYQIRRNQKTGAIEQIYGDSRPAWRNIGKDHPASRTSKRLRKAEA